MRDHLLGCMHQSVSVAEIATHLAQTSLQAAGVLHNTHVLAWDGRTVSGATPFVDTGSCVILISIIDRSRCWQCAGTGGG